MTVFRFAVPVTAALLALAGRASADSLKDIDHVVLFMQENRAFDHYFGTMAGVRGFNDANLQMNGKVPVWKQKTTPEMTKDADYVTPWYLNYLGGNWSQATQCMTSGSNGWHENHAAWNFGTNDHWAMNNTPWSIGFYKRDDVPVQWSLAENFIVGDMYQQSVVASTSPNRAMWASGSINVPGSPQKPNQGGNPYIDNNETPGCEEGGINCYPLKWKTAGEFYEDAGTTWQVYQDEDNFGDNPYAWFEQFQTAKKGSALYEKGLKGRSLDTFYAQAANGTLPEVSYIIGPAELSEHAPYSAHDGAWLENKIAQAVLSSPKYARTALIISFDETGGWFDHVDPYRSPDGTPGEWLDDPYGKVGRTFAGPGFRLPFYIISPWTRNGGVFTGHSDHNSQIMFIEEWQAAKGRDVKTDQMVPWRREHMSNLVDAFDFKNPDYSVPYLPIADEPHKDKDGVYDGSEYCASLFPESRPPVPYTGKGVIEDMASVVEEGFKPIRGQLTEGRHLVLEMFGYALTNKGKHRRKNAAVGLTRATSKHDRVEQRWVVHAVELGGDEFTMTSVVDEQYICDGGFMCSDKAKATVFKVSFKPSKGYAFEIKDEEVHMAGKEDGEVSLKGSLGYWEVFSVNY